MYLVFFVKCLLKPTPLPQHLQNKGRTTTGLLTYWHSAALNAVPPIYLKSLHSFWSTSCSASIRHRARWEPSPWPCHVLSSQALSAKSHLPMSCCTLPGNYWASEISTANISKAGLNSDRPKQGLINSLCCWTKQHRSTVSETRLQKFLLSPQIWLCQSYLI